MISYDTYKSGSEMPHTVVSEKKSVTEAGEYFINFDQYPYLKDHVFQDMNVLPGTFILDLALKVCYDYYQKIPSVIRDIKFISPFIMTAEGLKINIGVDETGNDKLRLIFSDKHPIEDIAAQLELIFDDQNKGTGVIDLNPDEYTKAFNRIDADSFYSNLIYNGNQYGPSFKNITEIKSDGKLVLAKLRNDPSLNFYLLNPALIDSAVQIISVLTKSKESAFVLDSIDEIRILNNLPDDDLWCKAGLQSDPGEPGYIKGNINIINSSGELFAEFSGVRLKFVNYVSARRLLFAANFTLDPVRDSLEFWNNYFNSPFRFQYTLYNQVFQQLLNHSGQFYQNDDDIKIILLSPEEWLKNESKRLKLLISESEFSSLIKDKPQFKLNDDVDIVHLNKYETDYLYKEIFIDQCYHQHGIKFNDNDTIIDIGANIGLFTLYVNQMCRNPRVLSYEPSPHVFELLDINAKLYCANTTVFNKGVSSEKKKGIFTYYPGSSVFSGFETDETEDTAAIKQVISNILHEETDADDLVINNYLNSITGERLKKETFECDLISVSDIIRENQLKEINLLKIDAEKSELEVLSGINNDDWLKIKQLVIEIHDKSGDKLRKIKNLLVEKGFQTDVDEEKYLHKSGLFNLYAVRKAEAPDPRQEYSSAASLLHNNIKQFLDALISFSRQTSSEIILGIMPPSPDVLSDKYLNNILSIAEEEMLKKLNNASNIYTIPSKDLQSAFNGENYYDKTIKNLANIPFTENFFAVIGTKIFRKAFSLINSGCKVIVLDCDNTLWKGLCGEDGYQGVILTENYKYLQKFILDQYKKGKLICLCSKNNEEDVLNVFDKRKDMILKKENFISSKINWKSKPENIMSLAEELNLNLTDFVFMDDNPLECAEVLSKCPSVTALNLPQDENKIPSFLNNIWIFDNKAVTEEDKKRTELYKDNIIRNQYFEKSPTLKDFIDGLNLNITIKSADKSQLDRAAQLTFRTNQFNFTTIRRNVSELKALLGNGNYHCLLTGVSDRFGDYGTVGVLIYSQTDRKIQVDTFLLSCRVLGRGVEYKVLSELGNIALRKNIKEIEIKFNPGGKNKPAFEFISTLTPDSTVENTGEIIFTFSPEYLSGIIFEPDDKSIAPPVLVKTTGTAVKSSLPNFKSANFQKIADKLWDIKTFMIEMKGISSEKVDTGLNSFNELNDSIASRLTEIWRKVLGLNFIGQNANFFDLGGTSLKGIQLIAAIKKELKKELSVVDLFEYPTVNMMAAKFTESGDLNNSNKELSVSRSGKRKRIYKTKRID